MYSTVYEVKTAHGNAVVYNERIVLRLGEGRKKSVFLQDVISVELAESAVIIGTACGMTEICFESAVDAARFEEELVLRASGAKCGTQGTKASNEQRMRVGEDEFAAALFGDGLFAEPKKIGEAPADFLARLADADAEEIIEVLNGGRQNFTDAELERIEAALVMKMET